MLCTGEVLIIVVCFLQTVNYFNTVSHTGSLALNGIGYNRTSSVSSMLSQLNWQPLVERRRHARLGVYIDADMSMRTDVTAVVRACFAALRQIRSVRRSLSRHALLTLVRALIVSKVDYCNSVLAGIPGQLQDRLQSVLNAAAHLVYSARRSERITPLLRELHWLRAPERVTFRLCVLAYRCLHGTASAILLRAFSGHLTSTLDVVCALLTQPCWWYRPPDVQHSVTVSSHWLRHVRGTACRRLSGMHHR